MMLEAGLRRSIVGALLLALVACLAPRAVHASWRSNVTPGSDIIMKDHRWPEWTGGTYYSIWSNGFKGGRFYGGHASTTKGGNRKPGMFWTHWGRIEYVASGPELYPGGPGGAEGSSGGYGGKPKFQEENRWYRFVMRLFHPADHQEGGETAYVAWWVKDVSNDAWYFHSMVKSKSTATVTSVSRSGRRRTEEPACSVA